MKKIFIILIFFQLIICLWGCSASTKLTKPQKKETVVSLKARDLYLKGLFYQSEGLYNEALVQFYQALHHDSTSATIYNSIAENHVNLGHYDSALILLKKALQKDPKNIESLELMADCYFRLRDDPNAISTYKKILAINPYNEDARKYLIFLLEKTRDDLGLAEQYNQLNEYYGKDEINLNKIADLYLKHKDYDKALDAYYQILKIDTLNASAYYFIGNVYKEKGMIAEADTAYHKALELKPDYDEAIQELALLYRNEQKWQDVIDLIEGGKYQVDSLQIFPKILAAEAHYYLRQYDEARNIILPLLRMDNAPDDLYELIARVEFEAKNYAKAKAYLLYLLDKDENNKIAWIYLGFTFLDTGKEDSAAVIYQKALNFYPDDATILGFYGSTLQQLERYDEAIAPLEKSLKSNPDNINAISSLAVVYESLSRFDGADSLYESAIKRFPENALLLNNYSYSLCERNIRLNEALEMVKKALEITPDNGAYLDTIGWIYYKLKNYNEAEKYIKKAIQVRENSAVVYEHLGDVYFALEKYNLAKENWQKALDMKPVNDKLKLKLEKIK